VILSFLLLTLIMNHSERLKFLKEQAPVILDSLTPEHQPKWGKMTPQHVVEHLSLSFALANGKIKADKFITPEDRLPLMKRFVTTDTPLKENTKSPVLSEEPSPLKYGSLEEAKAMFLLQLQNIFNVYEADSTLVIRNPVFGDLNYEEQLGLIYKHVQHHFRQFGLLPE
jgi:hypothetical protein